MTPYIFPGLSPKISKMIHPQPFINPEAMPLFNSIMNSIKENGGINLTIDYLMLENPKVYGWNQAQIRARIRSRTNINDSKGTAVERWNAVELSILLANPDLTAGQLAFKIKRSKNAIRDMRRRIRL